MSTTFTSRIRWIPVLLAVVGCSAQASQRPRGHGGGEVATPPHLAPLAAYLREQADADEFSGAVVVLRDGKQVFGAAHGFANRSRNERITTSTKFNLGSVDKLITRIALWQLAQQGRLRMTDTVGRLLPDFPNADVRNHVTVRQLYGMSSGVGNFWNAEYLRRRETINSVDDYLSLFAKDSLAFRPGERQMYSNGGYVILGKIIERLSGMSYHDYVRRYIADPAGMGSTRHYRLDERVDDRAVGYTRQTESSMLASDGPGTAMTAGAAGMRGGAASTGAAPAPSPVAARRPNTFSLAGRGGPAGGGYSTVHDFAKLDHALRHDLLLSAAFTDSLLGPALRRREGGVVQYGGGGPGTNTQFAMFPDGHTAIVFSNYDPPAATRVYQRISALVQGR
jgi:CubicO group peptidase (beta-lactamase class C family)